MFIFEGKTFNNQGTIRPSSFKVQCNKNCRISLNGVATEQGTYMVVGEHRKVSYISHTGIQKWTFVVSLFIFLLAVSQVTPKFSK